MSNAENTMIPLLPSRTIAEGPDQARALATRIELAVAMGQDQLARELHARLKALPLPEAQRRRMHQEFAVLDRLP
jgi:hypothetical protein